MGQADGIGRDVQARMDELSFVAHLHTRLIDSPPKQKGLRTRERLKIATAELLQESGFLALKAGDVTTAAAIAEGSFYMYFRDKTDATRTVLEEFLTNFVPAMMKPVAANSPFQAICETNRRWIALVRANAGIFRCLLQFSDGDAAFASLVQNSNREWYGRVLRSLPERTPRTDQSVMLLAIYLLGAMMDDLVRKLVVYPDQQFQRLLQSMNANDNDVADAASVLWMRILYGQTPECGILSPAVQALASVVNDVN